MKSKIITTMLGTAIALQSVCCSAMNADASEEIVLQSGSKEVPVNSIIDLNDDDIFNVADIVKLQMYLSKKITFDENKLKCADMNGDDNINVFDLVIMKRKLMEKNSTPPVIKEPVNISFENYDDYSKFILEHELTDRIVTYDKVERIGEFKQCILPDHVSDDYSEIVYVLDDGSAHAVNLIITQLNKVKPTEMADISESEINHTDMRTTVSADVSGKYVTANKAYIYSDGKLLSVSWNDDNFEYKITGCPMLYDYPIDANTFTANLLMINNYEPIQQINMSVYSMEELNRLRNSKEPDKAEFVRLIDSLPVPYIENSEITWINHSAGISEDTGKPYDIAYVTAALPDDEWVRLEYALDVKDTKEAIESILNNLSDNANIYDTPVTSGNMTIYAETAKSDTTGNGKTITWYIDYKGMFAKAVYKCGKTNNISISEILDTLKVVNVSDINQ